jgi:hypothetical protein
MGMYREDVGCVPARVYTDGQIVWLEGVKLGVLVVYEWY